MVSLGDLNPINLAEEGLDAATDVVETGVDVATDVVETGVDVATGVVETGVDVATGVVETGIDVATGLIPGLPGLPSLGHPDINFVPRTPDRPGFFEKILHRAGNVDALQRTSDEVLDSVLEFQQGFETYIPLYNDYTGAGLSFQTDIVERFDQLRGIDFGRLSQAGATCAKVATKFNAVMEQLDSDVGTGSSNWQGGASNAFLAHMHRFGTTSQAIDTDLGEVADATSESVEAVQRVVMDYTEALLGVNWEDFDSPDRIGLLIKISRMEFDASELVEKLYDGIGDLVGIALPALSGGSGIPIVGGIIDAAASALDWLISKFGEMLGTVLDAFGFGENLEALVSWVAETVRNYLDASFRSPFDANYELFTSATDTAISATQQGFQPVIDKAGQIQPVSYEEAPIDDPNDRRQPGEPGDRTDQTGTDQTGTDQTGTNQSTDTGNTDTGTDRGTDKGTDKGTDVPPAEQPETPGDDTGEDTDTPEARPEGLPDGAGWVTDPSTLPPGWTMDPHTGELTPPAKSSVENRPEPPPQTSQVPGQTPGMPSPLPKPGPVEDMPEGLPKGAGWIADPSVLPQGWTVDPATGELLTPNDPDGKSFPEVHSPQGEAALDTGQDNLTGGPDLPGGGTDGIGTDGEEVVVRDGDRVISVSGLSGPGDGVNVTVTDAEGTTEYGIELDEHGQAALTPDTPDDAKLSVQSADGGTPATAGSGAAVEPGGAGGTGGVSGSSGMSGAASTGGASGSPGAGADSGGPGVGSTHPAPVAGGSSASGGGGLTGPGGASGGGTSGPTGPTGGTGMMPMGAGAPGQGQDQEQQAGGNWRVHGDLMAGAETDDPDRISGILGTGQPAERKGRA